MLPASQHWEAGRGFLLPSLLQAMLLLNHGARRRHVPEKAEKETHERRKNIHHETTKWQEGDVLGRRREWAWGIYKGHVSRVG